MGHIPLLHLPGGVGDGADMSFDGIVIQTVSRFRADFQTQHLLFVHRTGELATQSESVSSLAFHLTGLSNYRIRKLEKGCS
jgi:hypothetical protein